MVTVAHALVHGGIRGTGSNLLFSLYVGQDWLSPATLSMGGAREEQEVDRHYVAAISFAPIAPDFSVNFPLAQFAVILEVLCGIVKRLK